MAEFGELRATWFAAFLDLPYGIPSRDTFNRVFAALDPTQFRAAFSAWMQAITGVLPAQVIALDGKMVRGSKDRMLVRLIL
jgi:DDE_Tnp_1-associated